MKERGYVNMTSVTYDLSNTHERLFNHSLSLFQALDYFYYDKESNRILLSNRQKRETDRSDQAIHSWILFSVGFECLIKSVLFKHECIRITKNNNINNGMNRLKTEATNYKEVLYVYSGLKKMKIKISDSEYLQNQLYEKEIELLYEIDTGTLKGLISTFDSLKQNGIIDNDEYYCLYNSLNLFSDVKRNYIIHTSYIPFITGSINNDVEKVYIPTVNKLLDIYYRNKESA